jgi:hypothetical protein
VHTPDLPLYDNAAKVGLLPEYQGVSPMTFIAPNRDGQAYVEGAVVTSISDTYSNLDLEKQDRQKAISALEALLARLRG